MANGGGVGMWGGPKARVVIGSGGIGLEMGWVWRRLGSEVTMLEALPTCLGAVDEQIAAEAHKVFLKQGLKIKLGVNISSVAVGPGEVTVVMGNLYLPGKLSVEQGGKGRAGRVKRAVIELEVAAPTAF